MLNNNHRKSTVDPTTPKPNRRSWHEAVHSRNTVRLRKSSLKSIGMWCTSHCVRSSSLRQSISKTKDRTNITQTQFNIINGKVPHNRWGTFGTPDVFCAFSTGFFKIDLISWTSYNFSKQLFNNTSRAPFCITMRIGSSSVRPPRYAACKKFGMFPGQLYFNSRQLLHALTYVYSRFKNRLPIFSLFDNVTCCFV